MIKLSKRLKCLAELAYGNDIVCDVGCDHGHLAIYLIQNNYAKQVIASDLRDKPLERCRENVKKHNLDGNISVVKSNGIDHVNKEVDLAIIAGMGGILVSDIITSQNIKNVKKLLIQANTDHYLVRKTLGSIGFRIKKEVVVEDGPIFYNMIYAIRGEEALTDIELKYGPYNIKNKSETFVKLLDKQMDYYNNLINGIPLDSKRYKELKNEVDNINKIINL